MQIDVHKLIASSYGLISDASSVIIDYILMNKPLGLTTNFLKNFKRGLIKELNLFNNLKYQKLNSLEDFDFFFQKS